MQGQETLELLKLLVCCKKWRRTSRTFRRARAIVGETEPEAKTEKKKERQPKPGRTKRNGVESDGAKEEGYI